MTITVGLWNILHPEGWCSILTGILLWADASVGIFKKPPQIWQATGFCMLQLVVGPVDAIVTCLLLYFLCHELGILVLGDVMWDFTLANQDSVTPQIMMLAKACRLMYGIYVSPTQSRWISTLSKKEGAWCKQFATKRLVSPQGFCHSRDPELVLLLTAVVAMSVLVSGIPSTVSSSATMATPHAAALELGGWEQKLANTHQPSQPSIGLLIPLSKGKVCDVCSRAAQTSYTLMSILCVQPQVCQLLWVSFLKHHSDLAILLSDLEVLPLASATPRFECSDCHREPGSGPASSAVRWGLPRTATADRFPGAGGRITLHSLLPW